MLPVAVIRTVMGEDTNIYLVLLVTVIERARRDDDPDIQHERSLGRISSDLSSVGRPEG